MVSQAAAELVVTRREVVDSAMDIEDAKKELYKTTMEDFASKNGTGILEGLYRSNHDFLDTVERDTGDG
jgi:hypothetical protein